MMLRTLVRRRALTTVARQSGPAYQHALFQPRGLRLFSSKKKQKKKKQQQPAQKPEEPTAPASRFTPLIGLEVHAQIKSRSKLFSGADTQPFAAQNTHVGLVDMAAPGALPVLNAVCVDQAIRTGLALGGTVNPVSEFIRKHYFYCDMPQGYQITQQDHPIVSGGQVVIPPLTESGSPKALMVERIQIEQDSGKNVHDFHPSMTFVDLNRAGVGLLEIVGMPDIRSAAEAKAFITTLQSLLVHLDVCTGIMAEGAMRCDVNISVNDEAAGIWGERVEIKNLSSLRAIERAIGYEIRRQTALCEANEPVLRETRGFDVVQGKTVLLRSKEQMLDYRFMAEPDLPPLRVSESHIEEIRQHMPELPEAVRARFLRDYQLSRYDCDVIIHTPHAINFYDAIVDFQTDNTDTKTTAQRDPKVCANWLTTELFGRLKAEDGTVTPLAEATATAADLAVIVDRVAAGRISGNVGKKLLDLLLAREQDTAPVSVDELIAQNDWLMITDDAQLTELCKGILADFPDEIAEYRATGNKRKVAFLIGHAMKLSKGKANPQFVSKKMFQLAK